MPSVPQGGMPLGTMLGVVISLLVAVVLGSLTTLQLRREEGDERAAREALLAESLAPVAQELEQANDIDHVQSIVRSVRRAELVHGRADVNLTLVDSGGKLVGGTSAGAGGAQPPHALEASMTLHLKALGGETGILKAWQDPAAFMAEMNAMRRSAWLDIFVTALVVILVVQIAIYLLVTRPLKRLVLNIEKLEQGYVPRFNLASVARELRWLEWRFARMTLSLTNGARLLVGAHRRALEVALSRPKALVDPRDLDPLATRGNGGSAGREMVQRYFLDRCARLEVLGARDSEAAEIARQVWEQDAPEAERLGEVELRARLENAALMVLDQGAFRRVSEQLEALVADRAQWCADTADAIRSALAADGVGLVDLQRRTKHVAGVWRKMQEKDLDLHEVHDIFAFRIIVADRDDCYLALNTVHRLFEPEPFRFKDYIADPKVNGYRSLHTSVRDRSGMVFEIQIRDVVMHREAVGGDAAHWRYHAHLSARKAPRRKRRQRLFGR